MDEFIRCFTPKTVSGCCRDYRAGATINFEMDAADKDKQITTPLLVLWGTRGAAPTDEYPTVWRKFARNLVTIEPLATGHYIQEEMPEQCLDRFFVSSNSSWPDSPRLRGCLFVATKRRTGKPRTHSLGCDVSRRRKSFPVDAK